MLCNAQMATPTGKKRRRLWRILLVAGVAVCLLLAAAVALLHSPWLSSALEARVERMVREATGRDCELRLASVRPLLLRAEVERFRIAGRDDEGPAFLELGGSRIDARWGPLLRGRLALSELRVRDLRIDLDQLPETGSAETPRDEAAAAPPTFAGLLGRVDVETGSVEGAAIRWSPDDGPAAIELRDVGLEVLRRGLRREYGLELRVGEAELRLADGGRLELSAHGAGVLDRRGLRLDALAVRGDGVDLEAEGAWTRLSPPALEARFRLDVAAEQLALPALASLEARGAVAAEGTLSWDEAGYRFDAELHAPSAGLAQATASDLAAHVVGTAAGWQAEGSLGYAGQRFEGTATAAAAPEWFPIAADVRWRTVRPADLADLSAVAGGPPLDGSLTGSLRLRAAAPALESIEAKLEIAADRLRVGQMSERMSADVTAAMSAGSIRIERLSATGPGTSIEASGSAGLLAGSARSRVRCSLQATEPGRSVTLSSDLLRAFGIRDAIPPGLRAATGKVEAETELEGPALATLTLDSVQGGVVARLVDLSLAGEHGLGLNGEVRAALSAGVLTVEEADLDSRAAVLAVSGGIGRDGLDQAAFSFSTESLQELLRRSRAELGAAGFADVWPAAAGELDGRLRLKGSLSGPWLGLDGSIEIEGDSLGRRDLPGRSLEADLRAAAGRIRGDVLLRDGDSELALALEDVGWPEQGVITGTVRESAPRWWLELAGNPLPLEGILTAEARLDLAAPLLTVRAALAGGRMGGEPFELRGAEVRWSPERLEVDDAEFTALGGLLHVDGVLLGGDGRSSVDFDTDGVDLAEVARVLELPVALGGTARFEGMLRGDPAAPEVDATVELIGLEVEGRPQLGLAGPVTVHGRNLTVDLAAAQRGSWVSVGATLEEAAPWSLAARYPLDIDLARFLDLDVGDSPPPRAGATGRLVAEVSGRGPAVSEMDGTVTIEDLRLELGDRVLTARGGPRLLLGKGHVDVAAFDLVAGEQPLTLAGSIELAADPVVSATAEGVLPLEPLTALLPGTRIGGTSRIDLQIDGPLSDLDWRGTATVRDGRFSHPSIPSGFDAVRASVELRPRRWVLDELTGRFGGGPVTGEGWLDPASGAYSLTLDASRARLAFSDAFRAEGDAMLTLAGGEEGSARLSGNLRISRAEYREDIDLEGQLLARTREQEVGVGRVGSFLDQVALDLEVVANDGVFVRNNLADFEIRTSLDVGGTLAEPLASGQATVLEGGEVTFRGVTYQVSRGNLDYLSSPIDNPRLDVEAQTTVSRYDVTLLVTGEALDPQATLSSVPPLPQADIVTLLLTGRTREDLGAGGGGLSEAQAALYVTGGLSREVETTLKSSLGLDEVRIDSALVEGETDPTARVTVGKRLTGKLTATYSRTLSANEVDLYQFRYEPRERLALVGRNDQENDLLAEILYNRRFYMGPQRPPTPAGSRLEGRKVREVSFSGNREVSTGRLRKDLGLHSGDDFRRSRLLSGLDEVRDRYLVKGYPEAQIESSVVRQDNVVVVGVEVTEGRHVEIRLDGWFLRKDVRRELLALWRDSIFPDTIAEDAAALMQKRLRELGYVRADVQGRLVRDDESGQVLLLTARPGQRVRVDRIVVEGNDQLPQSAIRAQMLTVEASAFGVLTSGWLNPTVLEQDLEAIRARYVSLGYVETPLPRAEILYPKSPRRAQITIHVEEGSRYRLGQVGFPGAESLDPDVLKSAAGLSLGEPYRDREVRNARNRLREAYDRRGYSQVRVEPELALDRDTLTVDLAFRVTEGERRTVDSVEIEGLALTRPWIARRELEIAAGDPLSSDQLARGRQNLYRTGLFRSVSVQQEPGTTEDATRITYTVEEGSNVRTDYGLGYSTDEGARGSVTLSHINLFGRRVYGSVGGRRSATDWRVFGLARQPNLLGTRLEGLLSATAEQERKDAFDVRSIGATAQIDRRWHNEHSGWFVGYGLEEADIFQQGVEITRQTAMTIALSDLIDLREKSIQRLGNLYAGVGRSTRNDFAWPTRGTIAQLKVSVYDELLLSEPEFVVGFGSFGWHHKLGDDLIWQGGVRLGLAEPYGGTQLLPISERFFAGGDTTIRGFARDSIFAVGFPAEALAAAGIDVDESLGGNGLFVVNQELMVPLLDPVWLVAFYDAGNVYWTRSDWDFTDLRMSAGLGLRLKTPIGPLRLEYGWKLDRQPEESAGRVHFSIGVPF